MIDTDEQDHEFFDILYQQWAKSTKAERSYWMPVRGTDTDQGFTVVAVTKDENGEEIQHHVASQIFSEADADFICGLHGAIPDLIRRLHEAIDEATSKDEARDRAEANLAEAYLENQGLQERIRELESELSYWSNR
ncbi:hypothetical protein PBI_CHE12_42 [Mycobacterium phage Che12]|uniref:Uncharacterized protein n=1 Tax=Mycobacterium phage Che12 TaxID=2911435 RepID=Q1A0H5_9CAUD|nr:gp42 [Mycobacterium phage Che12]ABE67361.1 hypothetical protein PBI_CHE12_42 [Mycobacterium phage Che12]